MYKMKILQFAIVAYSTLAATGINSKDEYHTANGTQHEDTDSSLQYRSVPSNDVTITSTVASSTTDVLTTTQPDVNQKDTKNIDDENESTSKIKISSESTEIKSSPESENDETDDHSNKTTSSMKVTSVEPVTLTSIASTSSPRLRDALRAKLGSAKNSTKVGFEKTKVKIGRGIDRTKHKLRNGYDKSKAAVKETANRGSGKVKAGYYRTKMNVLYRGGRYIVDYGFSLRSFAELTANRILSAPDKNAIREAISAFTRPLKTYQAAQQNISEEKLSSSLQEMLRLFSTKPLGSMIEEGDWKKGNIITQVFRRLDVDSALEYRDVLAQMCPTKDVMKQEKEYHAEAIKYFEGKDEDSWRYRKYISRELDWDKFEQRYFEVVTKLLAADPKMHERAKKYLAQFMFNGDSRDAKFQSLLKEAQANRPVNEMNAAFSNKVLLYPAFISGILILLL